jgi:uncharacterized protein YfaP (DUF2135 family)
MTSRSVEPRWALSCVATLALACGGGGGGGSGSSPPRVTTPAISTGPETSVALTSSTVGASGGTISASDASGPLRGFSVAVPSGATDENVTFSVRYADITGVSGLPDKSRVVGKVITIEATGSEVWNRQRLFKVPVQVTIPHAPPDQPDDILNLYSLEPDGTLEPTGFERQDEAAHTVTFVTRTFASVSYDPSGGAPLRAARPGSREATTPAAAESRFARYIQVFKDNSLRDPGQVLTTDFSPDKDGWYIPNAGSYVTSYGNCLGMTSFAKWYFKQGFSPRLLANYHDPENTVRWVDDATAIELATRIQVGMNRAFDAYGDYELDAQRSASRVLAATLGALYDTKAPVLLLLEKYVRDDKGRLQSVDTPHTVLAYQAEIGVDDIILRVYDPNYPKSREHSIRFVRGQGFDAYQGYNTFKMTYFAVGISGRQMMALKREADLGFKDDSWFPKVTITSIVGKNNGETVYDRASGVVQEGVTRSGEHKFVTNDRVVVIRGTVLGAKAQDPCCLVDTGVLAYNNKPYRFDIDNGPNTGDGSFRVEVPLIQGERSFSVIAAQEDFEEWAAFARDVIESPWNAAVEVSLGWETPDVDLDLYVKEPDQPPPGTKKGDTVFWLDPRGPDARLPFLDIDMTRGPGHEHYRAEDGSTTRYSDGTNATDLYGTYTARVHYYADHGGSLPTQNATFTLGWRYMVLCLDPCSDPEIDGLWTGGTVTGSLAGPTVANCCSIDESGSNWSTPVTFTYEKPDPSKWTFPSPSELMGP